MNSFTPGVSGLAGPSATPVAASSGHVAAATATATLSAVAGKINYLEQVDVTGLGATGASVVYVTFTGLASGSSTLTLGIPVPAGATGLINPNSMTGGYRYTFPTPIPASGANVAIVASLPSLGAGNTDANLTISGFMA